MAAFWNVLFLVLTLIVGIILLAFGMASLIGDWAKAWWTVRTRARAPLIILIGALAIAIGILLSTITSASIKASTSDTVVAVGTVSGAVITAIIAVTTLYAVILLRRAVLEQTRQLKASAIQDVGDRMLEIDRWVVEHPEYVDAIKRPEAEHSALGAAVAEVYADFIDQVVSQEEFLPSDHIRAWKDYFSDIIQMWPQLKRYMQDNPQWYLETMNQLVPDDHLTRVRADSGSDAAHTTARGAAELFRPHDNPDDDIQERTVDAADDVSSSSAVRRKQVS